MAFMLLVLLNCLDLKDIGSLLTSEEERSVVFYLPKGHTDSNRKITVRERVLAPHRACSIAGRLFQVHHCAAAHHLLEALVTATDSLSPRQPGLFWISAPGRTIVTEIKTVPSIGQYS